MSPEQPSNKLSHVIQELLVKASRLEELIWVGATPALAEARYLGVVQGERGELVQIGSDGLNLDQKAKLEHWLGQELGRLGFELAIYFKRKHSFGDRLGAPISLSQENVQPKSSPFGVKLRTRPIPGVDRIIAVSSGKGGVGKSTISVNLAVGLACQGLRVGILDADLYGPSVPMMMGINAPLSISAEQKMIPPEKYGVKVLSFGFMSDPYHPVIWRGPMVAKALEQLFYQAEWGELDYLIVDLPPGTGDVQLTMIESLPLFGGIVVSTPQAVALLDAHKGLTMFEKLKVPVLGLVENMAHFQCSACGHLEAIFGQGSIEVFSQERKIPIIAKIPLHQRIRESADQGLPVVLSDHLFAQHYMSLVEAVLNYSRQH